MNDAIGTRIVVVGAGSAALRFVRRMLAGADSSQRITVFGDEGRAPYDRTRLGELFLGAEPDGIALDGAALADDRVDLVLDDRVLHIDRRARTVRTRSRRTIHYDTLVLATGAHAARVAIEGATLPGCFAYRTIDDVESLRTFVAERRAALGRDLTGVVIGGGRVGLEAAGGLQQMDIEPTVVQYADRVMPAHLDGTAGSLVKRHLRARGIAVRTGTRATRIDQDESGAVTAIEFQDGSFLRVDVVIFTVGTVPRDELARNSGIAVDASGGVVIDAQCTTSDPAVLAIGDVASFDGRCAVSVAAGLEMADVAAASLRGDAPAFSWRADATETITLAGVEVVSFGDALTRTPDAVDVLYSDPIAGIYRKLVLADDAHTLLGGILVGDASGYGDLGSMVGAHLTGEPSSYVLPARTADA